MAKEEVKVKDTSQDHQYFAITPRIVGALARTPYDESLWRTVKDIAGESGECYISTEDLAVLSMMSIGQVHESRKFLLTTGLLAGEVRRDPGYQQPVWHLRVPDLWARNTEWCLKHPTIKSRLAYKRSQQAAIREERAKERQKQEPSPGEGIQKTKEHSPGEKGTTPGEKAPPPGELKNIDKKNQEEEFCADAQTQPASSKRPLSTWDVAWQLAAGVDKVELPSPDEQATAELANALNLFHEPEKPFISAFYQATGILPVQADIAYWRKAIAYQRSKGVTPDNLTVAAREAFKDGMTVSSPKSLEKYAVDAHARATRKPASSTTPNDFVKHLDGFVPRQQ